MKLQDVTVVLVMLSHMFACPYTKVEESFTLQALHDVLYHRLNISAYDHLEFPGVVPRSFLGAVVIAAMSFLPVSLINWLNVSKFYAQLIVRFSLGLLVIRGFTRYRKAVTRRFGTGPGIWLSLITLSQFHFLFYATRPLPNIVALAWVLHIFSECLQQRSSFWFIFNSAGVIIVFRSELAILMGFILIYKLIMKQTTFINVIWQPAVSGMFWLALTVLVDSYFWRYWLWPEGSVLWYNTVLNKSSNWGTSPFLWYFYSVIPRALGVSMFFIPVGLYQDRTARYLCLLSVIYVLIYSLLPHKELRFIIYVFPLLNTVAALGCHKLWQQRGSVVIRHITSALIVLHLLCNAVLTVLLVYISSRNYPGGVALHQLHQLVNTSDAVRVHIDVAAAQTGVSRFGQINQHWIYNKTEDLTPGGEDMMTFTHLILAATKDDDVSLLAYRQTHTVVHRVYAFSRVQFRVSLTSPVNIVTSPHIYVLKRNKL